MPIAPTLVFEQFPQTRLRRLRGQAWSRDLVAETHLNPQDLVWTMIVRDEVLPRTISRMPGVQRSSLAEVVDAVGEAYEAGVRSVALFPAIDPNARTERACEALNPEGLLCKAVRLVKQAYPEMGVIADVALDLYTTHGHDGLVVGADVDNDKTLEMLAAGAVLLAETGVDAIAPSDMMDGRVGVLRKALDGAGFQKTLLFSYAAKYASAFYGPYREAVGSDACIGGGCKHTYQMSPANAREALREVSLDIAEGADAVMIKPGLPYLDVIHRVKKQFLVPVFAFHVSGEYAMLRAAAEAGYIDYDRALYETMIAFKRAGADGIFTYSAVDVARKLKQGDFPC